MNRFYNIEFDKVMLTAYVIAMFFCAGNVKAQDFKKAIENLQESYKNIDKVHVVMDIQAFEDSLSITPYYSERAEIKRDGKDYLYHFGNNEMLMNHHYLIVVDKSAREIVCSKRDIKGEDKFFDQDPIKMNMDSLLNLYSDPHYIGSKDNIDHYKIFQKKGVITQIDMMIDTKENVLRGIEYNYEDGQHVKIVFEAFDKHPEFKADTFDDRAFMVFVKGKLKTAPAYSQYSIMEVKNK